MEKYRANVAAVVLDSKKQILIFEREDHLGWGFPQGGIEKDESEEEALRRELSEELGVKDFDILAKAPEKLRYDFPDGKNIRGWDFIGQEQQYFLVQLAVKTKINLNSFPEEIEFLSYQTKNLDEILETDFGIKTAIYHKALEYFEKIILE
ncbi:MAG: RNA pyrophosphohydrolase [Streptococcaceae bacterium]|jgi:putative (di)nucleoside polyphosphate hydrolase|nr:RNA pyrophosphohydrolase [Streptococcaceae bacterium]